MDLYHVREYDRAVIIDRKALEISEKNVGPNHPNVAWRLNNPAGLYKSQAQYAVAEPLYKRSLAILEKAYGPDHLHVATSLNNLAALYDEQGQYPLAEPLHSALAIVKQDEQKTRVDRWADLGFLGPHGYGINIAISLDVKSLNGYRPFAAFGFNVITGLTYSTGIEYQINPHFKSGLLFSVAAGKELGQFWDGPPDMYEPPRAKILLFNIFFDLIKSPNVDLLLGAGLGIANVNMFRESSGRPEQSLFATPAFSLSVRR